MADIGLIFDLDGTLIDSAPDIHNAINRVLLEEGLDTLSFAQVRGFIGNGVGVLIQRCAGALGHAEDKVLQDKLAARFSEIYESAHGLTKLYPGVTEALATLARNHPLAICTNKPEAPTRSVLHHFGLTDFFPVIVGGDTLPQKKPDPAPLLAAVSNLACERCYFVGDSEVDAETAKRAGLPFVLFTEGYRKTPAHDLGAVVIFDDWTTLPQALSRLSS